MKMQRGELVGFQGCLGYDYHPEDKSITVNEEEAEIIRYIFNRYIEGAGCNMIGRELEEKGYKTKRGNSRWVETTVMGIIKNEKYKGDIRQGKTFTLDPISKRRLDNFGEEDQFYIRDHHEPIVSEEIFESAQQILQRRSISKKSVDGKREKYSRKFAFSSMLECGFCGSNLSRRAWHSGSNYHKDIWQCIVNTKKGKKFCPDAKGIAEETIEQAFLESYRVLCQNNKGVMDELLKRIEDTLCSGGSAKELSRIEKEIQSLEQKRKKLVDMRLDDTIDKATYDNKYYDLSAKLAQLNDERVGLQDTAGRETNIKKRVADFRKVLEQNEVLTEFDRYVFESIVQKVIVGGVDDSGDKDPSMLTFVYKTGFVNSVDGSNHKPERKNSKRNNKPYELCSNTGNEGSKLCSNSSDDTCGNGSIIVQTKIDHIY